MLFIIASPIGNLEDFSFRAVKTLQNCCYILCEDTRHSRVLLNHYSIQKPLVSYHQHNEVSRLEQILADLKAGQTVALLSDAGTPGISDPGHRLVQACHEARIPVSPIPGACAMTAALSVSPLSPDRFQFIGFLPKTPKRLKEALQSALDYPGTTVCYESPLRLLKALKTLHSFSPDIPVAVCRELTKIYEEVKQGPVSEMIAHYSLHPPKGEIVLLIGQFQLPKEEVVIDPLALIQQLENQGLSRKDAVKTAAQQYNLSKQEIYKKLGF